MTFEQLQIKQLQAENEQLKQIIKTMAATIEQQAKKIAELEARLKQNSKNSSKPPSSDGLRKPAAKRTISGKKRGGQSGHAGVHLSVTCEPDEVIQHFPVECEGCPNVSKCLKNAACISEKRNVVDMVVEVVVSEHQALEFTCPRRGSQTLKGCFPENISASVQYGENLTAFAVALNTIGMVSVNRTHDIMSNMFNIPISTGTISNMVERCADSVTDTVIEIRDKVIVSDVAHFDETGTRVEGKTMWVHNSSTEKLTYLTVHPKRGKDGMDDNGVLPSFRGNAVHDCWASYWKYFATHVLCNAHILRELTGIVENRPEQVWAQGMIDLLLEMKQARDNAVRNDETCLFDGILGKFSSRYDLIIEQGRALNPLPPDESGKRGRKAKGKVRALVDRLAEHKGAVCLFARDFKIPFDNNQAERDIRMVKTKTKVSGCFRSKSGADNFAKIMSYIGTAKKLGINTFEAVKNAVTGNADAVWT